MVMGNLATQRQARNQSVSGIDTMPSVASLMVMRQKRRLSIVSEQTVFNELRQLTKKLSPQE